MGDVDTQPVVSPWPDDTTLVVRCECGFEVRGTLDELVPAVQAHGREAHNMEATREQVIAMAQPA